MYKYGGVFICNWWSLVKFSRKNSSLLKLHLWKWQIYCPIFGPCGNSGALHISSVSLQSHSVITKKKNCWTRLKMFLLQNSAFVLRIFQTVNQFVTMGKTWVFHFNIDESPSANVLNERNRKRCYRNLTCFCLKQFLPVVLESLEAKWPHKMPALLAKSVLS